MPYITVGKENSGNIELHYDDHGSGKPVVLIHGWPFSGASWERQVPALVEAGHRVIAYDRRGFGKSSHPYSGYNYDTFVEDLHTLITKLDLHDVTLVGFSMGGGEVARYIGKHGSERVEKAVLISAITPFLLKTADNPGGLEGDHFEGIRKQVMADRPAFIAHFLEDFFNLDALHRTSISEQVVQFSWHNAAGASPKGTLDCISTWVEDFRQDLQRFDIPTLVIHGVADRILPISATAHRIPQFVKGSRVLEIAFGPHAITWTHAEIINRELLAFLGDPHRKSQVA
jgi:pimeloyl-ACP methyl ester carboxylesterase